MQNNPVLSDIQSIIDAFEIDREGKIYFNATLQNGHDAPEASLETKLLYQLGDLIYYRCYAGNHGLSAKMNKEVIDADSEFTDKLRRANCSEERFDHGWRVEELEQDGRVLIQKGASKRYTYAGDFLKESTNMGALQKGEQIRLLNRHELLEDRVKGFYYAFGNTVLDYNLECNVRLYFNIKPEGADRLLKFISSELNAWQIPFQFKCLQHPVFYLRKDTAVLYFDKRYFGIVMEIMQAGISSLKPFFKEEVPLFTRKLTGGLAFAESPLNLTESFGTSRCKIIAHGMVAAWKEQQPKARWLQFILNSIEENFLRLEALYLNPNSNYPYLFPNF